MLTLLETKISQKSFNPEKKTRENVGQKCTTDNIESPFYYFKLLFDDELMKCITVKTNLYSTQCYLNRGIAKTCDDGNEDFLAMFLIMCIIRMPQYRI